MGRLILNTTTDVFKVPTGAKVTLHDGRIGTVEENMGDGQWLSCKLDNDSESELVHCQDLAQVETEEN